jgi:hypothetical protein
MTHNIVLRQGHFKNLTPTHKLIFVIVILEGRFKVGKHSEHEILGVNHAEIEVDGPDERLENILHDVVIRDPPVTLPLFIHQSQFVESETLGNFTQSLAPDHLRARLGQKSLLLHLVQIKQMFRNYKPEDRITHKFESFVRPSQS